MISPETGKLAMEEATALLAVFHAVLRALEGESLAWLAEQASLQNLVREVKCKTCLASNPWVALGQHLAAMLGWAIELVMTQALV